MWLQKSHTKILNSCSYLIKKFIQCLILKDYFKLDLIGIKNDDVILENSSKSDSCEITSNNSINLYMTSIFVSS